MRLVALAFVWTLPVLALPPLLHDSTSLHNAITRCSRALKARSEVVHGKRRELAGADEEGWRQLEEELAFAPTHRKLFRTRFEEFARTDLDVQRLLETLSKAHIDLAYFDAETPGGCQGNQLAYFIPGPKKREVGICLSQSEILGRYWVALAHETLHVFQFSQQDLKPFLTMPFGGGRQLSTRALQYTPDPRYLALDDDLAVRGRVILAALPPEVSRTAQNLIRALDEIKTLYLIYPRGEQLEFVPKKPWVIPLTKFYSALEEKLNGYTGWKNESADIRFGASALLADPLSTAGPHGEGTDALRAFSEQWYRWLQAHPDRQGHSREVQLTFYAESLNGTYTALLRATSGESRKLVEELFQKFLTSSRIMRGLLNYCVEMQANIQSKWLLYLLYEKLQEVPECASIYPTQWEFNFGPDAEENPFAADYKYRTAFDKIDEAMDKYTRHYISRTQSYGPSFSFLYGYDSFPNIFNAESCHQYKEEYLSFRP